MEVFWSAICVNLGRNLQLCRHLHLPECHCQWWDHQNRGYQSTIRTDFHNDQKTFQYKLLHLLFRDRYSYVYKVSSISNGYTLISRIFSWSLPNRLQILGFSTFCLVTIITSGKEQAVETHLKVYFGFENTWKVWISTWLTCLWGLLISFYLCKYSSLLPRMSERVNLPSNSGHSTLI